VRRCRLRCSLLAAAPKKLGSQLCKRPQSDFGGSKTGSVLGPKVKKLRCLRVGREEGIGLIVGGGEVEAGKSPEEGATNVQTIGIYSRDKKNN